MARTKIKRKGVDWKELLGEEKDLLKSVVQEVVQEILEGEMEQVVAAAKSERTAGRTGYRSGYYERDLVTRVGKLARAAGPGQRSVCATNAARKLSRARSTRKVKAITSRIIGHSFSAARSAGLIRHWTRS